MTQQNAALVEQATAASQAMADQARDLNEMMDRYRLSGSEARSEIPQLKVVSTPKPTAASRMKSDSSFKGGERRSGARPWATQSKKSVEPDASYSAPQPSSAAVAAGGSDADWQEF
jgi:methyl-accepting chemotaxis protein